MIKLMLIGALCLLGLVCVTAADDEQVPQLSYFLSSFQAATNQSVPQSFVDLLKESVDQPVNIPVVNNNPVGNQNPPLIKNSDPNPPAQGATAKLLLKTAGPVALPSGNPIIQNAPKIPVKTDELKKSEITNPSVQSKLLPAGPTRVVNPPLQNKQPPPNPINQDSLPKFAITPGQVLKPKVVNPPIQNQNSASKTQVQVVQNVNTEVVGKPEKLAQKPDQDKLPAVNPINQVPSPKIPIKPDVVNPPLQNKQPPPKPINQDSQSKIVIKPDETLKSKVVNPPTQNQNSASKTQVQVVQNVDTEVVGKPEKFEQKPEQDKLAAGTIEPPKKDEQAGGHANYHHHGHNHDDHQAPNVPVKPDQLIEKTPEQTEQEDGEGWTADKERNLVDKIKNASFVIISLLAGLWKTILTFF